MARGSPDWGSRPDLRSALDGRKASVGGKLTQLGSRLIDSTAKKLATQFFDDFQAQLNETKDASAALMEGVIAVHTGPELKADGIGDLIAGWTITSKDGTPMKVGAWSPLVTEIGRYVGDAIAIVVAETQALARQAAEAVVLDYEELPATVFADKALAKGAAELHANVPGNLIYTWEIGDADYRANLVGVMARRAVNEAS